MIRRTSIQKYLWWGVAVLVIAGAIWGLSNLRSTPDDAGLPALPLDSVDAQDWVKGNAAAPAVLIEFGDFQCPACRSYSAIVNQLEDEFGDELAIVYRHFPLRRIHLNADPAARAAEAAGRQGMFWEMHDLLFEHQSAWSRGNPLDLFRSYSEKIGLDLVQFEADMEIEDVRNRINQDELSAIRSGARGTPTFVLNGMRIETPSNYDEFRFMVQGAIADKKAGSGDVMMEGDGDAMEHDDAMMNDQ